VHTTLDSSAVYKFSGPATRASAWLMVPEDQQAKRGHASSDRCVLCRMLDRA
jgi:hypothetical protein